MVLNIDTQCICHSQGCSNWGVWESFPIQIFEDEKSTFYLYQVIFSTTPPLPTLMSGINFYLEHVNLFFMPSIKVLRLDVLCCI